MGRNESRGDGGAEKRGENKKKGEVNKPRGGRKMRRREKTDGGGGYSRYNYFQGRAEVKCRGRTSTLGGIGEKNKTKGEGSVGGGWGGGFCALGVKTGRV